MRQVPHAITHNSSYKRAYKSVRTGVNTGASSRAYNGAYNNAHTCTQKNAQHMGPCMAPAPHSGRTGHSVSTGSVSTGTHHADRIAAPNTLGTTTNSSAHTEIKTATHTGVDTTVNTAINQQSPSTNPIGSLRPPSQAHFLIIGRGRAARHFQHYLNCLIGHKNTQDQTANHTRGSSGAVDSKRNPTPQPEGTNRKISVSSWSRAESEATLLARAADATHVLFLISDDAIEEFLNHHPVLSSKICVHFSGRLTSSRIIGAHPLMTFGDSLYDLETYRQIPFILEEGRGTLDHLLPGLNNPSFSIPSEQKDLYHALCVMAGNFSVLLWEKLFTEFASQLSLPKAAALPYLDRIFRNLAEAPSGKSVLTGPLRRGDEQTIAANLSALEGDSFAVVYQAFVHAHRATEKLNTKETK